MNKFSFQIAIKEEGIRWYDYKKIINAQGKTFEETKELGFIVLKGTITKNEEEIKSLRNLYKNLK